MITAVSFSTIAHSTEDLTKVQRAITNLMPESARATLSVTAAEARGHHGNLITVLSAETRDKALAGETASFLMRLLPPADRMNIRDHIDIYYDGHSSLFLRVDKQSSYLGNPRLSSSDDVIRVKISFQVRGQGLEAVLKLLELA